MQKRVAEFFAGIGLMRMGLEQAGWQTVWANDIDEKKWEMYRNDLSSEGSRQGLAGTQSSTLRGARSFSPLQ